MALLCLRTGAAAGELLRCQDPTTFDLAGLKRICEHAKQSKNKADHLELDQVVPSLGVPNRLRSSPLSGTKACRIEAILTEIQACNPRLLCTSFSLSKRFKDGSHHTTRRLEQLLLLSCNPVSCCDGCVWFRAIREAAFPLINPERHMN